MITRPDHAASRHCTVRGSAPRGIVAACITSSPSKPTGPASSACDARLRADARGGDGGARQELAAGVAPMTNHHAERAASCAGLGRRVHHPVGRSGGHIRACPYSLVASQPAAPSACPPSQFLRRRCRARDFILLIAQREVRFGAKPENIWSL